jgi:hypothetical protein
VNRKYRKKLMVGWYYNQNVPTVRELRLDFETTVSSLGPKLRPSDTVCFPVD